MLALVIWQVPMEGIFQPMIKEVWENPRRAEIRGAKERADTSDVIGSLRPFLQLFSCISRLLPT